jgi:hypothetical protein
MLLSLRVLQDPIGGGNPFVISMGFRPRLMSEKEWLREDRLASFSAYPGSLTAAGISGGRAPTTLVRFDIRSDHEG